MKTLLGYEPQYHHLSDTYTWNLFQHFKVVQYRMKDGIRYVLYEGLSKSEIILEGVNENPSDKDWEYLLTKVSKYIWYYYHLEASVVDSNMKHIEQVMKALEK